MLSSVLKGKSMQQKRRFFAGTVAILCFIWSLGLTANGEVAKTPYLAQTISRVRENVASMHKKLPDFICHEEIVKQEIEGVRTIKETRFVLSLRAIHTPHDPANQFSESRDVISVTTNGKAENAHKYDPPLGLRGGFARDLFTFFDYPSTNCYGVKPAITSETKDSNTLILDVSLNKNVRLPACAHVPASISTARVWIDLKSLQVIRIQERTMHELVFSKPFAHTNGTYKFSPVIEYAPVNIHGVDYWLPRSKRVTFVKTKGQYSTSYSAQYTDYHKFVTSITIMVPPAAN